jgi:cytochrome c
MKIMSCVLSLALVCMFAAVSVAADGQALYVRCQGCHGPDASKLMKSKAEADVLKALQGYKAKTYGGDKKTVMENQVKNLSDEDIQVLAKYMSTL